MIPVQPTLAAALLCMISACSNGGVPARQPYSAENVANRCGIEQPKLWGQGALASQYQFASRRVGGLSGIDYRRHRKDFLLISDDRGAHGGARVYRAILSFGQDGEIGVRIEEAIELRQADGSPFADEAGAGTGTDAEAIRAIGNDRIYWASEAKSTGSQGPQIFKARLSDRTSKPLTLPAHLVPVPGRPTGPRDNRSFEGLSIDPEGGLWVGLEAPLLQDGNPPSATSGSWTRIVRLAQAGQKGRNYLYPLEPIARQLPGGLADNGLSELLALQGPAFLVLERSGRQQQDGGFDYVTRIFCAYPSREADAGGTLHLAKQLVAEVNRLGSFDNANFEGMTFGPRLPDGRRSLILVADNDFRDERPTIFALLAFR